MKLSHRIINGRKLHSWRPQLPDHRDYAFRAGLQGPLPASLPPRVEPLARHARVHDQGMTNSCVGHAVTTALEVAMGFSGDSGQLSRLMAYYHARSYIGETNVDEGCYIRDAFRGLKQFGVSRETNWRWSELSVTKKPTVTAMKHAALMREEILKAGIVYEAPKTLTDIKAALAIGQPVVFGFVVYENIFDISENNNVLEIPPWDSQPLGGHAVLADGYDDETGLVSVQNSWGRSWGNDGYFLMPYEWFTNPNYLTGDFWTCRQTA